MPIIQGVDVPDADPASLELRAEMLPAIFPKKFWTTYAKNPDDILNPTPIDWVAWGKRGDKDYQKDEKVERVRRDMPAHWQVIRPYYDHWKTGQEMPQTGTPLKMLPGTTDDMVDRCRQLHIRTIEEAAQMNEESIQKIGFGARDMKERAGAWLQKRPNRETDNRVAGLEARLAEMQAALAAAQAPKKRGRKPKAQEAAE